MEHAEHYLIGYVSRTSGLKGEIVIKLDVHDPSYYTEIKIVFLDQEGSLIPYMVENLSIQALSARIKLEDVNDRQEASELVGSGIYLPLDQLPALGDGEYYLHDLIGFEVFDEGKLLGLVDQIFEAGSQNLFSLTIDDQEVLVPINGEVLKEVNLESRKIEVELPEGLLDIYLK